MNTISSKKIDEIMNSIEEGVSKSELIKQFPEHVSTIENILETKKVLTQTAKNIPEPLNESLGFHLSKVGRKVESPFITKLLSLNMKYKTILPVLVIGIAVVGGTLLLSKKNIVKPDASNDVYSQDNYMTDENGGDINQNYPPNSANISSSASIDDITAGLSSENAAMRSDATSDGINSSSFASSDLSEFNQDNYDF